jgi:hypothetical protein
MLTTSVDADGGAQRVFITTWLLGSACLLIPIGAGLMQSCRFLRGGTVWTEVQVSVLRMATQIGITRPVRLVVHPRALGPMTCGVMSPVVVLPSDATKWSAEDLDRAVRHELEHVRRGDWLIQLVVRVGCACCWFHPLVWLAARQLLVAAEQACDDEVVCHGDACGYAAQLVALAERHRAATFSNAAAMAGRDDLTIRVRSVLDPARQRGRVSRMTVGTMAAVALALTVSLGPLRAVRHTVAEPPRTPRTFATVSAADVQVPSPSVGSVSSPVSRVTRVPAAREREVEEHVVRLPPELRKAVQAALADPAGTEAPAMRVMTVVRAYPDDPGLTRLRAELRQRREAPPNDQGADAQTLPAVP